MQISKISQPMFCSQMNGLKTQSTPVETQTNSEMIISDNYGRAMVNFRGADKLLFKQDEALLKTLGETLGLSKEKAIILKDEFSKFLKENNLKSLTEAKFADNDKGFYEECEFIGELNRRITESLHLSENEDDVVNLELLKMSEEKENYVPGGQEYAKDMLAFDAYLKKEAKNLF